MSTYKNITSGTSTTLLAKQTKRLRVGDIHRTINKITISNNNSVTATGVCVSLFDGTNTFYFIKDVEIPAGTTLVLEDNLSFDIGTYNLTMAHDSGSGNPNLTVIIK